MHPILQKLQAALAATAQASLELDAMLRTKGANPATLKSARAPGFSARRQLEGARNLEATFERILSAPEPTATTEAPKTKK